MKLYAHKNTLCLIGKGWQIRAFCRQFKSSDATLADYLELTQPDGNRVIPRTTERRLQSK